MAQLCAPLYGLQIQTLKMCRVQSDPAQGVRILSSNPGFNAEFQTFTMCLLGHRPHPSSEIKLQHVTLVCHVSKTAIKMQSDPQQATFFVCFFEAVPPCFWSCCLDVTSSWRHESTLPSACSSGKLQGTPKQASQLKQSRTSVSGQNGNRAGDRSVNLGQKVCKANKRATDLTAGFQVKAALH